MTPTEGPSAAPRPADAGSPWPTVAVAAACSLGAVGAIAAPRLGVPTLVGTVVAAGAALLTVLALPSFPTRRATVLLLGIAGMGALRHVAFPATDSIIVLVWAAATLVALVLVDRAEAEFVPQLVGGAAFPRRLPEAARAAVAIGAIVVMMAIVLVPTVTDQLGRRLWPGSLPSFEDEFAAPASLRALGQLDMTTRPRLSDRVVFTVDAARPDFWRGELFDVWDGDTWTRSDGAQAALPRADERVRIAIDRHDDGALTGPEMRQTFSMKARFSEVIFAAPSPVAVETDKMLVGRPDGTAAVVGAMGQNSVYTVTSRRLLVTEDDLRAAAPDAVPAEIRLRYAQPPTATPRVRQLATAITAGATTTYDKIRAIERWLGAHTEYSLDAPLSPRGVDVVDHFLFEARKGWCEQVASSLVVLARSVGIPARLATGFVPGERDRLTGRFTVRERDAHAWTEIYFAGVGWQGFDPTASVPLAGEVSGSESWLDAARDNAVAVAVVIGLIVAVVAVAPTMWASIRRSRRRQRSWGARTLARLERVGRRAGRPRDDSETPREYACALARHVGDPELTVVGDVLDREAFGRSAAAPERRAAVDEIVGKVRVTRR